jgi:hypothetical protein
MCLGCSLFCLFIASREVRQMLGFGENWGGWEHWLFLALNQGFLLRNGCQGRAVFLLRYGNLCSPLKWWSPCKMIVRLLPRVNCTDQTGLPCWISSHFKKYESCSNQPMKGQSPLHSFLRDENVLLVLLCNHCLGYSKAFLVVRSYSLQELHTVMKIPFIHREGLKL